MSKGIEIRDIAVGAGEEAQHGKTVVLNLRAFLHQGEEVFVYPEPRVRIDLKGRKCIAGLRKGIIGMRVGGKRTIIIAPHLAYGAEGVPGKVPANALLQCEVELLEVRGLRERKSEDLSPGKRLSVFSPGEAAKNLPRWQFEMLEGGYCSIRINIPIPGLSWRHTQSRSMQWRLGQDKASAMLEEVMTLPEHYPSDCLPEEALWSDSSEPANGITRDRDTDTRCLSFSVSERGQLLSNYALKISSLVLENLEVHKMIKSQIEPAPGSGCMLNQQ